MSNGSIKQQIASLLQRTNMSSTHRIVFLFDILHEIVDRKKLNDLCTSHLIPALVKDARYSYQFIALLRTKFDEFPLPQHGPDDLELMMKNLRGSHRQAARFFLTAINNKATDTDICNALSRWKPYVQRDREQDPDGRHMSFDHRETAINRLLDFRDDIESVNRFLIVWKIITELNQMPALLNQICDNQMFMPMVDEVAVTPGGMRLVQEKLLSPQHGTRTYRDDEQQSGNPTQGWQPEQPPQPGEDWQPQPPTQPGKEWPPPPPRRAHHVAYARAYEPQYVSSRQETNKDELSRVFNDTDETKHISIDLDELLVRMKSLA